MEKIIFLAHTEPDGSLAPAALETLGAAVSLCGELSAELSVGIVGEATDKAAESIGGCGAARFLSVSGPEFSTSRYASDLFALDALCKASEATLVLAPATSRFSRVLPGVAARLNGRADTHLTAIAAQEGKPIITRWFYRQRMWAEISRETRPWIMTLEPGCFEAWQGDTAQISVEQISVELPKSAKRTTVVEIQSPPADEQTIRPEATILFVAGAGWTKKQTDGQEHVKEAGGLILNFVDKAQASLGSSKSLVDLSTEGQEVLNFMSHLHQVGQTGATPRHKKGLSTCCHGEEPHVVGWRFITERRAVNLDAACGWAQGKADVLYVADAFEVMAKVNEQL